LIGVKGRKTENLNHKIAFAYIGSGLLLYFTSIYVFNLPFTYTTIAITYIALTTIGFLLFITGSAIITRIIQAKITGDILIKKTRHFRRKKD